MSDMRKTVLHPVHIESGAKMMEFGGWDMPVQYPEGIQYEHLQTRLKAGLFDVSHMGRFIISGADSLSFLQHTLSNNAAALKPGEAQYTIIPTETGGAVDDAYLYYFREGEYLLVVNAGNRNKDWDYLTKTAESFDDIRLKDKSEEIAMISLQGPKSKEILESVVNSGQLPDPMRNSMGSLEVSGIPVDLARTGYTGEPICFELFCPSDQAVKLWNELVVAGACPVGLGARDTLRLEAGLPLYGHELGNDPDGVEIPVFAIALGSYAVSLSDLKGDFIGRESLARQQEAKRRILQRDYSQIHQLPRRVRPFALIDKGLAREGSRVFRNGEHVGYVSSGTAVPYWGTEGEGIFTNLADGSSRRSIGLAYIDSDIRKEDLIEIEVRGKMLQALVVPYHLRSEAPPFTYPISWEELKSEVRNSSVSRAGTGAVKDLLEKSISNTKWRQEECLNLIPSEMTSSTFSRMLSIMDPAGRYAEHKKVKAFRDAEVFYYQGTDFIDEVETLLADEMSAYLGCNRIEARVISGQMANTAVFSAMMEYINRGNRKVEPSRMRQVMNNHIIRGGHLSAQPMGALKDFVAKDPRTEQAAVINFPVLDDNPYKIDVEACKPLLEQYRPDLVILGKSMIIHKEPVAQIRSYIEEMELDSVLMYDMAHVLGLVGPHFQKPFDEGADLVTGSTHKTFFGTQRGVIGGNFHELDKDFSLWQGIERRAFPGSVSNHHLGTLLGLLMSAYEMNSFKEEYQKQVISNAKAFAVALKDGGLDVAGDPAVDYTETHQVIVEIGYSKGPEVARRLEESNIVVNYQATPQEEGFSASGAIRIGVSEMTRFGMNEEDFRRAAGLLIDVIRDSRNVAEEVKKFRSSFVEMKYCFTGSDFDSYMERLGQLV